MGQFGQKNPRNEMGVKEGASAPMAEGTRDPGAFNAAAGAFQNLFKKREEPAAPTYTDYKTAPGSQLLYGNSLIDANRGDPNQRKAAPLEVKAPVAPAAPAAPTGPDPNQIAAQQAAQQAAAVAAQQAAFWAQHEASQRMKREAAGGE